MASPPRRAKEIAKLGYAGINVTIVRTAFAQQHPDIVQGYVCAAVAATKLIEDPSKSMRAGVFKASAALTGQPVDEATSTGEQGVIGADVKLGDEVRPLVAKLHVGADGKPTSGGTARNYLQTVSFLVNNGKIDKTLTANQILPYIDGSYVKKTLTALGLHSDLHCVVRHW